MDPNVALAVDVTVHIVAFLLKLLFLYLFLRILAKDASDRNILRLTLSVVLVMAADYYATRYLVGLIAARVPEDIAQYDFLFGLPVVILAGFIVVKFACDTAWGKAFVVGTCLVAFTLSADHAARLMAEKYLPEEGTLAQYLQHTEKVMQALPKDSGALETNAPGTLQKALDGLATLTDKDEMRASEADFRAGVKVWVDRRALMASMSETEIAAYRGEMVKFMTEQGLSADMYSLAALRDANPTNVAALAELWAGTERGRPARSIEESLAALSKNLAGIELTEQDLQALRQFTALLDKDDAGGAIDKARQILQASGGQNKLAGAVLAALLEVRLHMPAALLLADDRPAASAVGRRMIPVPTRLGVVRLPECAADEWRAWTDVAQRLRIKGFGSLGNQTCVVLNNNAVLLVGDTWKLKHGEYVYAFQVDEVWKGMVYLSAAGRSKG